MRHSTRYFLPHFSTNLEPIPAGGPFGPSGNYASQPASQRLTFSQHQTCCCWSALLGQWAFYFYLLFILFFSSYSRSQQFPPLQVSTISCFLIGNNATWLHTLNFVRRRRAHWTQPHPCVCMCMCVFSPSPSSRQAVSMVRHRERRGAGFWGREEEQKQGTR